MEDSLETRLKRQARVLGFDLVGVAPAGPADGFDRLRDWLGRGFAGEMDYMHRHGEARRHPDSVLPDVRSVVMLGTNYLPADEKELDDRGRGRVARYRARRRLP